MKRTVGACFMSCLLAVQSIAAVRGDSAAYVGGTANLKPGIQGSFDVSGKTGIAFSADGKRLAIPYDQVTSMEFGQKVGRRVGATVALGVTTLGVMALPMLFSKKKKHYLTIGYNSPEGGQAAVFELAKDTVRPILASLEARTGRRVEHDDPKGESKAAQSAVSKDAPATTTSTRTTSVAPPPNTPQILTNFEVYRLVRLGNSDESMIAAIDTAKPDFDLRKDELAKLRNNGVSEAVITAMVDRMNATAKKR